MRIWLGHILKTKRMVLVFGGVWRFFVCHSISTEHLVDHDTTKPLDLRSPVFLTITHFPSFQLTRIWAGDPPFVPGLLCATRPHGSLGALAAWKWGERTAPSTLSNGIGWCLSKHPVYCDSQKGLVKDILGGKYPTVFHHLSVYPHRFLRFIP